MVLRDEKPIRQKAHNRGPTAVIIRFSSELGPVLHAEHAFGIEEAPQRRVERGDVLAITSESDREVGGTDDFPTRPCQTDTAINRVRAVRKGYLGHWKT